MLLQHGAGKFDLFGTSLGLDSDTVTVLNVPWFRHKIVEFPRFDTGSLFTDMLVRDDLKSLRFRTSVGKL